jgi:hypothetical protein
MVLGYSYSGGAMKKIQEGRQWAEEEVKKGQ